MSLIASFLCCFQNVIDQTLIFEKLELFHTQNYIFDCSMCDRLSAIIHICISAAAPNPRDWPYAASLCEVPSESKSIPTAGRRELTAPEPEEQRPGNGT
jgi:hypothetical protein